MVFLSCLLATIALSAPLSAMASQRVELNSGWLKWRAADALVHASHEGNAVLRRSLMQSEESARAEATATAPSSGGGAVVLIQLPHLDFCSTRYTSLDIAHAHSF
jgi:hypothetical protein